MEKKDYTTEALTQREQVQMCFPKALEDLLDCYSLYDLIEETGEILDVLINDIDEPISRHGGSIRYTRTLQRFLIELARECPNLFMRYGREQCIP